MKTLMTAFIRIFLKSQCIFVCLISSVSWAEITYLSSEELTDTYIKDTTVIVRQPKKQVPKVTIPVSLKITPSEKQTQILPEDQMQSTPDINAGLHSYDDFNNFRSLDNSFQLPLPNSTDPIIGEPTSAASLQNIQDGFGSADLLKTMQDQFNSDTQLQDRLGLDSVTKDISTLGFNGNLANNIDIQSQLPSGTQFSADDRSMTFTIPNLGNFNSQQIKSPNGEIGVNVTPSQIQYTINLPK